MAGLVMLAILLIAAAVWIGYNKRNSPERREQRRRLFVNREGRLWDAMIIDVIDDSLVFQYEVSGVSYTGSQDVSTLRQFLPGGIDRLIGMVASFLAGLVALKILSKLLEHGRWWVFGLYCMIFATIVMMMHIQGY